MGPRSYSQTHPRKPPCFTMQQQFSGRAIWLNWWGDPNRRNAKQE
jgi:hypothetical protein